MGEISGMVMAFMVGALFIFAMTISITDFARPETYNATLSSNSRGNLTAMYSNLSKSFDMSVTMKENTNNTAVTAGDISGNPFELGVPSIVGIALNTFSILGQIPDLILEFAQVVIDVVPFPIGYVITAVVAIAGITFVFALLKVMLKVNDI